LRCRCRIGDAAGALSARDDGKLRGVVLFSKSQDAEAFADPSVESGWLRAAGGDRENKRATRARCRYASELASRGFRVLGIGSSAEMVEVALKRPVAADRDLTSFKHPRQLRAILCRGVLNDFLTDKDRERAARPVCRASEPGGVWRSRLAENRGSLPRSTENNSGDSTCQMEAD
jgi:hypothetical protein